MGKFFAHAVNSGLVSNRIDIEDSNLFTPAGIAGIQRPGKLMTIHAKGIENPS